MKVTEQHLAAVLDDVLEAKKKEAKIRGVTFEGVPRSILIKELDERLGSDSWCAVENDIIKITKDDVNAMANGRFYRKVGLRLLLMWGIVVLGLATLNTRLNILAGQPYSDAVYYILESVATIIFMTIFARGQRKERRELRASFESGGFNLGKD